MNGRARVVDTPSTLPAARPGTNRVLYHFRGGSLRVGGHGVNAGVSITLRAGLPVELVNGPTESELLLLQVRPIGEPVVSHGPFVMNSRSEIVQAFEDYRRTRAPKAASRSTSTATSSAESNERQSRRP